MLHSIYAEFGGLGTLIAAFFIIGTTLSWFQAIAGVVVSNLSGVLKILLIGLMSVIPPVSVLVAGFFLIFQKANSTG